METILKNVVVKSQWYYKEDDESSRYSSSTKAYRLVLEIPIPGGKALYELIITEDMYNSLEAAQKLASNSAK